MNSNLNSKHRSAGIRIACLLLISILGFSKTLLSQIQFTPVTEEWGKLNLNGIWKFCPNAEEKVFSSAEKVATSWHDIKVPACWVMQGYKVDTNKYGSYYRTFKIPENWIGKRIKLRNEGAYSIAKVYINRKYVGMHEGGLTPFEFDITPFVKTGTNHILIAVKAQSMADTLGCVLQYMNYPMGGIIRDIYLFTVPDVNITSVHTETDFDNDFINAVLNIDIKLANKRKASSQKLTVNCELIDQNGQTVVSSSSDIQLLRTNENASARLSIPVDSPVQWNPEKPYLYTLRTELLESGSTIETIKQKIGFREIFVVGNRVFVNGQPVKLRGVNRHETHPLMGRSLTREIRLKDAILFKEANVNYIRTSHYPPSEEFISICDSLGFFVELENPFCWVSHGAGAASSRLNFTDPKYLKWLRNTTIETVEHYRNHPSVIIWSMANESYWSENWNKIKQLYDSLDMSRPKTFHDQAYGGYNNFGSTCMEIANIHYPGPLGADVARNFERPLLFGEYCHLNVYNRQEVFTDPQVRDDWGEVFEKNWESMYKSEGCLGGAIWSGIDDVFLLPDSTVTGYGPWGPVDGWRRTKPEYWHLKNVYSPVKISNHYANYDAHKNEIFLQIENRNIFTNLNEIKINWEIENESGTIRSDLAPLSSGWITIVPKTSNLAGKKLKINFSSPTGYSIVQYELPVGKPDKTVLNPPLIKNERYTFKQTEQDISISGNKFTCIINRKSGMISSLNSMNKVILNGGPELMVLALKTNECAPKYVKTTEPLNSPLSNWKLINIETGYKHDSLIVKITGSYDEAAGSFEYIFNKEGEFYVNYNFTMSVENNPRQYGLLFQLGNDFKNLSWERKAQWSVYPENHIGRPSGSVSFVKNSIYNDLWHPEVNWKDDANELGSNDFRSTKKNIVWAHLVDDYGTGVKIISNGKQSIRVFKNSTGFGMLIADFHSGGGEMFLEAEYATVRRPLKNGDTINGAIQIQIEK